MAADVAIYPVDARGLIPDHSFDAENRGIPSGPLLPGQSPVLPLFDFSTMLELASRSGGKAYFNTNGLEQSVRNAVFAGQCSYTLGFYTSEDPDNRYHSIQILIDRERVHLRYRPGYWAFSNGGYGSSSQAELRVALASPFTAGSIRLQARAVRRPRSSAEVRVTVFIDSSKLAFHKEKNAWSATIDLLFGQKNAAGRVFAIAPYRVPLRVSNKAHVSRVWLSTETVLLLRSQSRSMRIVVRDVNTGAIGSLDIPADKIGLEKQ